MDKIFQFEDYAIEECKEFCSVLEAIAFIRAKGGDIAQFGSLRGVVPI